MTSVQHKPDDDLVGLSITGGLAYFPGLTGERVRRLVELDPVLLTELLEAAEVSVFFTRPALPGDAPVRPDARIYHVRLHYAGRARLLTVTEPFQVPELARLVGVVRRCFRTAHERA